MTFVKYSGTRLFLASSTFVVVALLTTGCASHQREVPTWGGTTPSQSSTQAGTYQNAPVVLQSRPVVAASNFEGRTTFTQGCTGSFSMRDARTNREISSGRAFNSGRGLIALDNSGRQTRAIASSSNLSVTFLPDCNCRAGANQSGALPVNYQFAAQAPAGATCTAS